MRVVEDKDPLIVEGELLAEGGQGQLTAEEWLGLYLQVKKDLKSARARKLATLESQIREWYPELEPVVV